MKIFLLPIFFFFSSCSLFMHPNRKLYKDPIDYNIKHEVIKFKNRRNEILTGIFFPAQGKSKATIVHFHGNAQNMSAHWTYSQPFSLAGYNVFIFDYSGFGASQGKATVKNAIEDGADAIKQSFLLPNAEKGKIVIFAQSIGGAIAPASMSLLEDFKPAMMIIEGSFYSYKEIATIVAKRKIFFWPMIWYPYLFVSDKFSPKNYINKIDCPKLFIHSEKDDIVDFTQGLKYYEKALPPKVFWETPSGHIEAFGLHKDTFLPKAIQFLDNIFLEKDNRN